MQCIVSNKPLLLDADALNIASTELETIEQCRADASNEWIITPHHGEAARLLQISNQEVQLERIQSVKKLQQAFNCISLQKAVAAIFDGSTLSICDEGNPYGIRRHG